MQRNFGNSRAGNRCDVSHFRIRGYDPHESSSGTKSRNQEPRAVPIGVRSKTQTGGLLGAELGASRAQFRLVWMNVSGEAGIQALAFEPPILGIGLPKVCEMVGTG
jgi:hypothetical protein